MLTRREFGDYLRFSERAHETSLSELRKHSGLSEPMLKYELHRMRRAGCVYSPSRGRYRFVDPGIWASVVRASKKFPKLPDLAGLYALEGILGVSIYGSWARGEASQSSDYDLLIVVRDPSCAKGLDQKPPGADVRVLGLEDVIALIKKDPIQIVPILRESVPVYGGELLEYLKNLKFDKGQLLASLHEALASIDLAEAIVSAGEDEEVDSALLYPPMLRFRQYCLVRSILEGIPGTLKQAEEIAEKHGLGKKEFRDLYEAFRLEQRGVQIKIKKTRLLKFLKLTRKLVKGYVRKHRPKKTPTERLRRLGELKEEFMEVLHAAEKTAAKKYRLA